MMRILTKRVEFCASASAHPLPVIPTQILLENGATLLTHVRVVNFEVMQGHLAHKEPSPPLGPT